MRLNLHEKSRVDATTDYVVEFLTRIFNTCAIHRSQPQNFKTAHSNVFEYTVERLQNVRSVKSAIEHSPERLQNVQSVNSTIEHPPERLQNVQSVNSATEHSAERLQNVQSVNSTFDY